MCNKYITEKRLKKYIKNIVQEAINNTTPYWELEKTPRSSKENEIKASWDGFENTLGDYNGHIPTKINYPNSYERNEYEFNKDKKEDILDADPYDDYPSAFTTYDDDMSGYAAMQAMSDNHNNSQYHKQHWQGRTDNDGNLVWKVDFDKVVENVIHRIKNKISK